MSVQCEVEDVALELALGCFLGELPHGEVGSASHTSAHEVALPVVAIFLHDDELLEDVADVVDVFAVGDDFSTLLLNACHLLGPSVLEGRVGEDIAGFGHQIGWHLLPTIKYDVVFLMVHSCGDIPVDGVLNVEILILRVDDAQLGVVLHLRLHEPDGVDGREHDAVGRVGGDNLLRHIVVVLYAEGVDARVGHLLHLVVEEAIHPPVVLIDIECLRLCLCQSGLSCRHQQAAADESYDALHGLVSLMVSLPAFTMYTPLGRWRIERVNVLPALVLNCSNSMPLAA